MSEIKEARLQKANSLVSKGFASYAESFKVSHNTQFLIQKFDLARSLLEMGELNQGSKLLNEIISKSKDTDLIDQVQLLKNKFLEK